jgi:hypothetical protein
MVIPTIIPPVTAMITPVVAAVMLAAMIVVGEGRRHCGHSEQARQKRRSNETHWGTPFSLLTP